MKTPAGKAGSMDGRAAGMAAGQGLLDRLVERLRARGVPIRLDQLLRAQALIASLDGAKADLGRTGSLGLLLAPVLATSRETQRMLLEELSELQEANSGQGARAVGVAHGLRQLWRQAIRRRLIAILMVLVPALGAVLGLFLLPRAEPDPIEIGPTGGPIGPVVPPAPKTVSETSVEFLELLVLPALYVLLPAIVAAAWILRSRPKARPILRRMTEKGRQFETLPVPRAVTDILGARSVARDMALLRHPKEWQGTSLDAMRSIRSTLAAGGAPTLRWQTEAHTFEYLLLCERSSPADHMGLIADALTARLDGARVSFTRYDWDVGIDSVRHVAGRRSGPVVDTLAQVRQRHQGARLILLGNGESLSRRFDAARAGRGLAELLAATEAPLLLTTVPIDRWGWREAQLADAGVSIFPADPKGITAAVAHLTAAEGETEPAAAMAAGEDPLLSALNRDWLRYASDTSPMEAEVALLLRRLKSYLAPAGGFPLLAAIAAFPRMEPAITARVAHLLNGRPLDSGLAARLANLPWLRHGRMPDWLRLALLRSVSHKQLDKIREALVLMLDDLRASAAGERASGSDPAARLEILSRPGVIDQLASSLGLRQRLVSSESIFIRFLQGEPLDELDQPDSARRTPQTPVRIFAAAFLVAAGCLAAGFAPHALAAAASIVSETATASLVAATLIGYGLLALLISPIGAGARRPRLRPYALFLHIALYVAAPPVAIATGADTMVIGIVVAVAALHALDTFLAPGPWRPREIDQSSWRLGLVLFSIAVALPVFLRAGEPATVMYMFAMMGLTTLLPLVLDRPRSTAREVLRSVPTGLLLGLPTTGFWVIGAAFLADYAAQAGRYFPEMIESEEAYNIFALRRRLLLLAMASSFAAVAIGLSLDRRFLRPALVFAAGTLFSTALLVELGPTALSGSVAAGLGIFMTGILASRLLRGSLPEPRRRNYLKNALARRRQRANAEAAPGSQSAEKKRAAA